MRFFGKSEEEIQEWIDSETIVINVLPENWLSVEIFRQLKKQYQVTMGGTFMTGYDRNELLAVMDIYEVPKSEKIEVLKKITIMEVVTVNKLNA